MRHGVAGRKFRRTEERRCALLSGLVGAIVKAERIRTTLPRVKSLRPVIEKLITTGKAGTVAARRRIEAFVRSDEVTKKIVDDLGPRFLKRPGGYTRIVKAGYRHGDNAPMAVIEFVDPPVVGAAQGAQKKS